MYLSRVSQLSVPHPKGHRGAATVVGFENDDIAVLRIAGEQHLTGTGSTGIAVRELPASLPVVTLT
jgi:hypothetical protein